MTMLYTTDPLHLIGIAYFAGILSAVIATAGARRRA